MELLTSLQNPKIKNLLRLSAKASERREQNRIVVEGLREIGLAVEAGFAVQTLFWFPELLPGFEPASLGVEADAVFEIGRVVFEKIAYREGSDGLIALLIPRSLTLPDIRLSENPFVIVMESVEKPGNLGAVLRTADAARVSGVLVCDPKTDLYNPNVIRSSVGCVFTVQVAACTTPEALDWLKQNNIRSYGAALTATHFYHQTDLSGPCAIVMGTEATGLSDTWLQAADELIKIPMRGKIDSLNVSTSTAILAFEAMRQRGFGGTRPVM